MKHISQIQTEFAKQALNVKKTKLANDDNKLNPMVTCQKCGHNFNYNKEPEATMGTVICPTCQSHLDQTGKVL
jgi:hypothetical protein